MSEKTQKKGFFSNWIVRNLLTAFVIAAVLIVGVFVWLFDFVAQVGINALISAFN